MIASRRREARRLLKHLLPLSSVIATCGITADDIVWLIDEADEAEAGRTPAAIPAQLRAIAEQLVDLEVAAQGCDGYESALNVLNRIAEAYEAKHEGERGGLG